MTKQKEEVLDLIKEKFQDRDAALTRDQIYKQK